MHECEADNIEHAMQLSRTKYFWWIHYLADLNTWNFLWQPAPWESHQRHAWPSQHQKDSEIYLVPKAGYTDTNYHAAPVITRQENYETWITPDEVDIHKWDYSWHPDPTDPPYIYEFATTWHDEGGPVYITPGATQRKYITDKRATLTQRHDNHWHTLEDCEWDYSWHPHPKDPPYIYVFGNQWWPAEKWATVEYHVPGATQRKYMEHPRAKLLDDMMYWGNLSEHRYHFDYSWKPDPGDPPYRYVFGNQWHAAEVMPTVEWLHPAATEDTPTKYVDWPRATLLPNTTLWTIPDGIVDVDVSWVPDPGAPPYVYHFGTQYQKTGGPVYNMPGATEVHYIDHPRAKKISIDSHWTIPDGIDTESFDLTWHPDATELPYIYQFATQHQKTGGPVYTVPGATETKYLEHIEVKVVSGAVPVVEIDHMDGNGGSIPDAIKRVRYFDNYRDTLIRLAKTLQGQHEFVWVCSSICDYTNFDFTWHPEQWQQTMLHVFASNEQKFGDTFYMHVPTFAERAEKKALLEWYSVNFVPGKSVPRRPLKHIVHSGDTHVDIVQDLEVLAPLTVYTTGTIPATVPTVPLWREETKTVVPLDAAASVVIVPRVAKPYIKTQLYDYPYIDKTHRKTLTAQPQDIVFISYDEPEADRNWEILHSKFPHSHRVHGVAGMERALEAAADVSTTPWYWAVFAKTEIAPGFDFAFVPDYMQQPKHYIFNCRNMVNGLEYGHMGMVLYNCRGIRDINRAGQFGLDYTLSFPHESIPVLSCLGRFNTTPYHTWRTAFRETAKLAFFESEQQTVEGQYRLRTWLERAEGDHAEWCLRGARDGEEFFETTGGDLNKLKQSFRWEWLREYFQSRYGNLE